jgi:hypothetical protein
MNLVFCPNRLFAIYLLAYISGFGNGRRFQVVILGDPVIPNELMNLASNLKVTFIKEDEVTNQSYEELIIHSYSLFALQSSYILGIDFKALTFYSDGMRNGFYGLPRIDPRLKKLIYFGVELRETSFENCLPASMNAVVREVVSFAQLSKVWADLQKSSQPQVANVFTAKDLLLVMRYWNQPDWNYEFRPGLTLLQYLREELSSLDGIDRLIFRADPRVAPQIQSVHLKEVFAGQVEIVMWEDLFRQESELSELYEPESVIWSTSTGPRYFFGFDSSLNVLVGNKWRQTEILWPRRVVFSKYFDLARSSHLVSEQISWMKEVNHNSSQIENLKMRVEGFSIEQIITKITMSYQIDSTQERDALTQERDALTQERDALTQERDALTQERDALVTSTIWKTTKSLRGLISWLKKYR